MVNAVKANIKSVDTDPNTKYAYRVFLGIMDSVRVYRFIRKSADKKLVTYVDMSGHEVTKPKSSHQERWFPTWELASGFALTEVDEQIAALQERIADLEKCRNLIKSGQIIVVEPK